MELLHSGELAAEPASEEPPSESTGSSENQCVELKKKIHSMPKFRTRQESPSEHLKSCGGSVTHKLEMRFYWNQSLSWNRFFVFQPSKKRLWARKTSSRVPSFSKRKNRLGRGGNNTKPWLSFFGWIQQKFRSSWWLMISKKEEVINGKLDTTNELLISC